MATLRRKRERERKTSTLKRAVGISITASPIREYTPIAGVDKRDKLDPRAKHASRSLFPTTWAITWPVTTCRKFGKAIIIAFPIFRH